MINSNFKNTDWQLLLLCACGMTGGLAGWEAGFLLALASAAILFFTSFLKHGYLMAFQVQVHMTYFAILLAASPEPVNGLYWLPTLGTWAYLLFDYCLLARLLSLLPYNSSKPFTLRHVRDTFIARPTKNILNPA